MPAVPLRRNAPRDHFVLCGDNPLTHRLAEELVRRFGRSVTVILPAKKRRHGPQIAALPGTRIVEAAELDDDAFQAARVDTARAVAILGTDDVQNIHAALRAQELNPELRLVVRMDNTALGHRIRTLFADCAVLSDAGMAAPAFVAAAFGEQDPSHVRIAGRTLFVAERDETHEAQILCGLAATRVAGGPNLLPEEHETANLVLALADGKPRDPMSIRRRSRPMAALSTLMAMVNRRLLQVFAALLGLVLLGTVVFGTREGNSPSDAVYLTILGLAGATDTDTGHGVLIKATQVMVTLVGIALIPVIFAVVVDSVVRIRLTGSLIRLRKSLAGHVVVVGLGQVGTRVMRQVHDLGIRVVCIDNDEEAPGIALARRLKVPVVFGDATDEETLRAAHVDTSGALVAVTSDDITNLEAGLHALGLSEEQRVVMRLFDEDLAARVQRNFRIPVSRSVASLAAPAFAAAMMERQVIGTIPVGRQVMLIAEVAIGKDSELDGRPMETVHRPGHARVIALSRAGGHPHDWAPHDGYVLAPDDRLVILATRTGIGSVLARSVTPDPADADEF